MTCSECRDALVLLADADAGLSLGPGEAQLVDAARAHVVLCSACRTELTAVREATALFQTLTVREPSLSFDARVLGAFFAEQAALAPRALAEEAASSLPALAVPRWVRRLAVGYAAGWGVVATAVAVWMVAGGWRTAVEALARLAGPVLAMSASAAQHAVEYLASLVVALRLADRVFAVLTPATLAVGRALQPTPIMITLLVSLAGVATLLALMTQLPRVSRRRTRHVHAILWTA